MSRFLYEALKKTLPHLHWILRYLFFYIGRGRLRSAANFLYATFFTEEEGILSLFDHLYRKNFRLAPLPRRIELEPTTRCSLRCLKCEQRYWKEQQKNMSLQEFKRVLEQFPRLRAISLTGIGHGFEHPEYMEMLRYCKAKGLYTQFFDTFLLLNEERAREIIKIGVDRIMVSIDGATAQTYEKLQVGSRFDRVIGNLNLMLNLKKSLRSLLPEICFVYVVMKDNVREMAPFLDLLQGIFKGRQPVIWIQFIRLITFEENEKFKVSQEEYDIEAQKAEERAEILGGFRLSLIHSKPTSLPPRFCTAWTVPFITVEGDVYPCCTFTEGNIRDIMRTHSMGNVFVTDFEDLWNSEKYMDFKATFHKGDAPEICRKYSGCNLYDVKGTCEEKTL